MGWSGPAENLAANLHMASRYALPCCASHLTLLTPIAAAHSFIELVVLHSCLAILDPPSPTFRDLD